MLFSLYFQELFLLELSIDISYLTFLLYLFFMKSFVLFYYLFVLPSSPYLILNLLLLTRSLLYCTHYYPLSSIYLDHLVSFLLLNYHLSPPLLSLMPPSLSFSCSESSLLSHLLSMSRLRTQLWLFSYFTCLFQFFSSFRSKLFIRLILFFLEIFPLKLINSTIKFIHSLDFSHSLIMTFF